MKDSKERLYQWLRSAHAMEKQAERMLTAQAARIEHYPKLKKRIEKHIEETQDQAARLERLLSRRDQGTSTVKDMAGQAMAMVQGAAGVFAGDEVIKGSIAGYTFEHMEIANYKTLIAAAEELRDETVAKVCRENCKEEIAMADWLANHLDEVTQQFLRREDSPELVAKR
jgi:ferritin-like metal-binding protein YciE